MFRSGRIVPVDTSSGGPTVTSQMLLCPGCRARVLANWTECKFCGESLASESISANVDPDRLAATPPSAFDAPDPTASAFPAPPGSTTGTDADLQSPPAEAAAPTEQYDWSQWVNVDSPEPAPEPVDIAPPPSGFDATLPPPPEVAFTDPGEGRGALPDPPAPPDLGEGGSGPSSWDATPSEQRAEWAAVPPAAEPPLTSRGNDPVPGADVASSVPEPTEGGGGALTPFEGSSTEWVAGPAPVVPNETEDAAPSGLEPVAWYVEPSGSTSSAPTTDAPQVDDPATSAPAESPSLFGDRGAAVAAGAAFAAAASHAAPDTDHEPFDQSEIFRDDGSAAPGSAAPGSAAPGSAAPGSDLVAPPPTVQWKASSDAWDQPVEPEGKPKGQPVLSREARLLAFGIVLVVIVALVGRNLLDRKTTYPSVWTGNVQPIADYVAKSRGLGFKHPIAVTVLDGPQFEQAVREAAQPIDAKTQQALADEVAAYRALGLLEGNPTATLPYGAVIAHEDRAFYDLRSKHLIVRAGTSSPADRVAVAGALSVALDDQYADLSDLLKPTLGADSLVSIVSGNEGLAEDGYVTSMAPKDRMTYQADVSTAIRDDTQKFLGAQAGLRSALGPPFVQLVRDSQGKQAVNEVTDVPPSDLQILNPAVYFEGQRALIVDAPPVPEGAALLETGTMGAMNTYLLLSERGSESAALSAVNSWSGDAFTSYRQANGQVCITVNYRGSDSNAVAVLTKNLENWQQALPDGHIKVEIGTGDIVSLKGCDPGASASAGITKTYSGAVDLAVARSRLAANYYTKGTEVPNGPNGPIFTTSEAVCIADRVTNAVGVDGLDQVTSKSGDRYRTLTLAAGASCNSNLVGQLFATN